MAATYNRTTIDSKITAAVSSLTNLLAGKAATNDTRLTDQRVPTDGSVTNAKVAASAAVSLDKTADSATRLALAATERTKLAGIATGATANRTDTATDALLATKQAVIPQYVNEAAAVAAVTASPPADGTLIVALAP